MAINNLFDLSAVLRLDSKDFEEGIQRTEQQSSVFGDVLKANLVTKGIDVAIAGFKRLSGAAVGLVKESVAAFGNYEQLVGGIDTLFGESSQKVQENAANAFKTAGMSANDYMATTIQFSASLIQGLQGDTEKAAEFSNMAITDMSDNVNKMGTSMKSVQDAYRGLARQNFTMLDNLSIGYQGTAEEMARLINDSKVMGDTFTATAKNVKDISFDKYIEAIHVIQKQMGITGTTAAEAGETIQGSVGAVGAAWKNLVTGIADPNANLGKLIDNLVQSAKTALRNLIPTIRQALTGLATLIRDVAPVIAAELPGLINDILPPLIEAATTLIVALVQNLPTILTVLFEALPKVMESIGSALMESWPAIQDALLGLLDTTAGRIVAIIGGAVLAVKGFKIVKGIGDIISVIGNLVSGLPALLTGLTSATTASEGLAVSSTALSGILGGLATAFLGVADALLITYDVMALDEAARTYADANETYLSEIDNAISNYKKLYDEKGKEIADQWANMVYQIDTTNLSMEESQKAIAAKIETYWDGVPKNMWEGFQGGWNHYFGEGGSGLFALMGDAFSGAVNGIRGMLGISSPSKVFAEIGRYVDEGFAEGVVNNLDVVDDAVDDLADAMYNDNMYQEQELQTVSATVIGDRNSGGAVQATSAGTAQDITLVLELDGEVLARKMFRYNKNESNRRGNSFVVA